MAAPKVDELGVPPDAQELGGREILQAFIVDEGLSVSLVRGFEEPSIWGLLLADLARHAARIFASETKLTEAEALHQICDMCQAEWQRPTDLGETSTIN
jgi:Domain of unknown function (DUF5076)